MCFHQSLPLFGALFVLYIIWDSTYFVTRIGAEGWPPLMTAGVRFLVAGILLPALLLLRGHKLLPLRPLLNVVLIGLLLLAAGNGVVTVAEHQNVPSSTAAVVVATVSLFTLRFSHLFGTKTHELEWVGIVIGLTGTIMFNSGGNLSGNPRGAISALIGPISWVFGSVYGSRIILPIGVMVGVIEMPAAGVVLMITSMIAGEKLTALPSLSGFLAVGYLVLLGSIIATNAYMHLIRNVSPAFATSYAYANPVVAVPPGMRLSSETLSKIEWLAPGVIVFAVILVMLGKYLFPAEPIVAPAIPDASSK